MVEVIGVVRISCGTFALLKTSPVCSRMVRGARIEWQEMPSGALSE